VQLVSLQRGTGSDELQTVKGQFDVLELPGELDKTAGAFMDTAAIMMNLDLVISADTAAAHLAGGLGVPVWVPLSAVGEWRWLLEREDTPWYPTMRLFRQKKLGAWRPVFRRMAREVACLAEAQDQQSKDKETALEHFSSHSRCTVRETPLGEERGQAPRPAEPVPILR